MGGLEGLEQGGDFRSFIMSMRREGSYDTGEAMFSRNGITVCGFVNSLQDGYTHCRQLSALPSSLGSIFVLGPTVTSQIPYMKIHLSCL